jgi:hypothetical protein
MPQNDDDENTGDKYENKIYDDLEDNYSDEVNDSQPQGHSPG